MTTDLQTRVIVTAIVGKDYSQQLVEWEHEDGRIELV